MTTPNTLKKTVLLIDDDRDFTSSAKAYLEHQGFSVLTANNGTEGQEVLIKTIPDLIVMDVMMDHDAEGLQLARKLRQQPTTQNIPILIVSGFTQHLESKMKSFEFILGDGVPGEALLEKPVDLKTLSQKITTTLNAKSSHRA